MKRHVFLASGTGAVLAGCATHANVLPFGSSGTYTASKQSPAEGRLPSPAIVGEIHRYDGAHPPRGWMVCDGRSLHVSEYRKLYKVLGHSCDGNWKDGKTFGIPSSEHERFVIAYDGITPTGGPHQLAAIFARRMKADKG